MLYTSIREYYKNIACISVPLFHNWEIRGSNAMMCVN